MKHNKICHEYQINIQVTRYSSTTSNKHNQCNPFVFLTYQRNPFIERQFEHWIFLYSRNIKHIKMFHG